MTTTAPPTVPRRRRDRADVVVALRPGRVVVLAGDQRHATSEDEARRRAMARHPVGSARLAPVVPLHDAAR